MLALQRETSASAGVRGGIAGVRELRAPEVLQVGGGLVPVLALFPITPLVVVAPLAVGVGVGLGIYYYLHRN